MKENLRFSIIVPVYNRPQEVDELLESLCRQEMKNFEVVLVEDGSAKPCTGEVEKYKDRLTIKYYFKDNSGPGLSRNYGCEKAEGNYFIILDSDCILPPHYVGAVKKALEENYTDAYGGPDRAHASFIPIQKAINYSMTSFFTTGGIRGGGEKLDKFYPRSFNMGYSKEVFEKTGGFSKMRFGEDIDFSIRILGKGFKTKLIKDAWVYHKRRSNLRQFYKQVYNSGIARINLMKRHPGSLKAVHALPSLFVLGHLAMIVLAVFISWLFILPLTLHILLLFLDATFKNKSIGIGGLAIITSYFQLIGYGLGFITAFWKRIILGKDEYSAFARNFYK
ncbi:MAG: glycosyl transferase family 2 [Bacteroidetes bacterium HGW-Bacteroidetes-21]|nr:MAG: glycosyl transferase family 2 [Bacteroidetes bacterium HGW-Bacteroidetes-21]